MSFDSLSSNLELWGLFGRNPGLVYVACVLAANGR